MLKYLGQEVVTCKVIRRFPFQQMVRQIILCLIYIIQKHIYVYTYMCQGRFQIYQLNRLWQTTTEE
jgi:hypothetical protein